MQTNETRPPPPEDTLGAGVKVVVHGAVPGSPGGPCGMLSPTALSIGSLVLLHLPAVSQGRTGKTRTASGYSWDGGFLIS